MTVTVLKTAYPRHWLPADFLGGLSFVDIVLRYLSAASLSSGPPSQLSPLSPSRRHLLLEAPPASLPPAPSSLGAQRAGWDEHIPSLLVLVSSDRYRSTSSAFVVNRAGLGSDRGAQEALGRAGATVANDKTTEQSIHKWPVFARENFQAFRPPRCSADESDESRLLEGCRCRHHHHYQHIAAINSDSFISSGRRLTRATGKSS